MKNILFLSIGLLFYQITSAQDPVINVLPGGIQNLTPALVGETNSGDDYFTISGANLNGGSASTVEITTGISGDQFLFSLDQVSWNEVLDINFGAGTLSSTNIYIMATSLDAGVTFREIYIYDINDYTSNTDSVNVIGLSSLIQLSGLTVSISNGDMVPGTLDDTDFGYVTLSAGSHDHTFTIKNNSSSASYGGNLILTSTPKVVISGTDASDFTLLTPPSSPIATNNGTTTFVIRFTPGAEGTRNATLTIANNSLYTSSYVFAIQGTGVNEVSPIIDIKGNGNSIANNDITPSSSDYTDYGDVNVNLDNKSNTFYIHNTGTSTLTLTDHSSPNGIYVWIDGTNASEFSVTTQPASTIATSANDDFVVRFTPTGVGIRNATIHVSSDASNISAYSFAIQGRGVTPEIDIQGNTVSISSGDMVPSSSDHTDFGSVNVTSGSLTRTFTIWNLNTGSYPGGLYITGSSPYVAISGTNANNFTVVSVPSTSISVGGSTTFQITFDPNASGTRTATVTITSNDMDEGTYTFGIQGFGAGAPAVTTNSSITSITNNSASNGGNVTSDGGLSVTARGVCWSNFPATPSLPTTNKTTDGSGTGTYSSSLTSLSAGTRYNIRAYATNSAGTSYGSTVNFWTLANPPSSHPASFTVSSKTQTSVSFSWNAVSGATGYIILQKSGLTSPTATGVTNGIIYSSFSLPSGTTLAGQTLSTTLTVSSLSAGTNYSFTIIAYGRISNDATFNYKTDGTLSTLTVRTNKPVPSTQATSIIFSNIASTSMTVGWTRGDGDYCLVLAHQGASVNADPADGTTYSYGTDTWNDGTQIGTGNYVIYSGTGTSTNISGLTSGTAYYFEVFEMNNDAAYTLYKIGGGGTNNPNWHSTMKLVPTIQAKDLTFPSIGLTSLTLSWTAGNGDYSFVIGSLGSSFPDPADGDDVYSASSIFGSGTDFGGGYFVIYKGTNNSVAITNLIAGNTYNFKVFTFNNLGTTNLLYLTSSGSNNPSSQTTASGSVTWAGTTTDWHTGSNWSNSSVPTSGTNVIINSSSVLPTISSSTAACNNLTIDPNCFLVINNQTLNVSGNLTINCNSSVQSGQIQCIGTGAVSVTGTTNVNLYIKGNDYNQVASPVSGATVAAFTGFYVKKYSETGGWVAALTSDPLTPLRGFGVKFANVADRFLTLSGPLYTGSQSTTVSAAGTAEANGWNLIGNPYISTIDWEASSGWTKGAVDNTIYIFYELGNYSTYNAGTHASTGGGSRYIAPMQSFFVHKSTAGDASFGMDNNVRVAISSNFLKTENEDANEPENMLKLKINSGDMVDEAAVLFYPGATKEFDSEFDALKLFNPEGKSAEIFSITPYGQRLTVNTLPEFEEDVTVPIGFIGKSERTFKLTWPVNTMRGINIILEDLLLERQINLLEKNEYEFTSQSINEDHRFKIHFTKELNTIGSINDSGINIYIVDKVLYINDNKLNNEGFIIVYDVMGKEILRHPLEGILNYHFNIQNRGAYIVEIITGMNAINKKIIIE